MIVSAGPPDADRLHALPLFAELSAEECEHIAPWCDVKTVEEGREFLHQGEFGYAFFVIESGTARVVENGVPIRSMGPGDYFGEMAIFGAGERTASIESTSPLTLISMHGLEFRQVEIEQPAIAAKIKATMQARLDDH